MGKVILHFSMSLDGFVASPDVSVDHAMGIGGERLHDWMGAKSAADDAIIAETFERVGAVVLGRRTYDVGLRHWLDTPYPAPSFVLTHEVRPPQKMKSAAFTFVNDDIESAVRQAKVAAGGKDVTVMGADIAQQAIKAGLADAIQVQLIPMLLGGGTRLFEPIGDRQIDLLATRVLASDGVTHLDFDILHPGAAL
jgi:dihydrofolate reductase